MKKIFVLILFCSVISAGCKKTLDINQNPNQPTSVTPNVVLSASLVQSAGGGTGINGVAANYINLNCWLGYWARSGSYQPDVSTESYAVNNSYTDVFWTDIYLTLNGYNYLEKTGEALHTPFYVGVAKVMKAFHFSTLVDLYDDIPYSEAFDVSNIQPKYDKGQDVYNDLIKQLDSAIFYFEDAKNNFYPNALAQDQATDDKYDIVFGSARLPAIVSSSSDFSDRMLEWEKFANTLELKLLIHQSQVTSQQSFIQQQMAKITANGFGFLGAGESAAVNPGYQVSNGKQNPLYGLFYSISNVPLQNQSFYRANSVAVNFYLNTNDTRGFLFYAPLGNTIAGNFEGDPNSLGNTFTSAVGSGIIKGSTQDQLLLSDFESLFLQSEASQRGWLAGNAQTFYESAITQSYVYLYIGNSGLVGNDPVGDAQAYFTSAIVDADWNASPNKLEAILTQKWAALNGINWVEAYTDYRRTGIPSIPITAATNHLVPQIPVRFLYPEIEYNTNASKVPVLPNLAQFTQKIFWNQ